MTFAQRRNLLTTHFSERIAVVKRRTTITNWPGRLSRHYSTKLSERKLSRQVWIAWPAPVPSRCVYPVHYYLRTHVAVVPLPYWCTRVWTRVTPSYAAQMLCIHFHRCTTFPSLHNCIVCRSSKYM